MIRRKTKKKADVCLFLEGTYPYVPGGVSTWTHELIKEQSHLKFHIVALLAPNSKIEPHFKIPENVVGITNIYLQDLPEGANLPVYEAVDIFSELEGPLIELQSGINPLSSLTRIINILSSADRKLGKKSLLDSEEAWQMFCNIYNKSMAECAFIDYFWSCRALLGGLYTVLLADLPEADIYHALCTGYAGLFLARAKIETGKACLVTEHGIYTNERRIEISSATWLFDQKSLNLSLHNDKNKYRELRDFWIDSFAAYSKLCYDAADRIITLYKGNQDFQILDGAKPEKMQIIPNGIDFSKFSAIPKQKTSSPIIALIGRVVPIKDIKTFIRASGILKEKIPGLKSYIMGSMDEDPEYFNECKTMVEHSGLNDTVIFTGKVNIAEYMEKIDVIVLTSISEAQPLVILEAGAAGIPCVATDVGACREMIMGPENENPKLGPGGAITPLSNPRAIAAEIAKLITDREYYKSCSEAIKERVKKYYNKSDQHSAYKNLYSELKKHNAQESKTAETA